MRACYERNIYTLCGQKSFVSTGRAAALGNTPDGLSFFFCALFRFMYSRHRKDLQSCILFWRSLMVLERNNWAINGTHTAWRTRVSRRVLRVFLFECRRIDGSSVWYTSVEHDRWLPHHGPYIQFQYVMHNCISMYAYAVFSPTFFFIRPDELIRLTPPKIIKACQQPS